MLTLTRPYDFTRTADFTWRVASHSADRYILVDDAKHVRLIWTASNSSLVYANDGSILDGEVYKYSFYYQGNLVYELTGDFNAVTLQNFARTPDNRQAEYQYLFREDDALRGSDGDDTLVGYAGRDELNYGNSTGADVLAGGQGDDWYYVNSPDDRVVELPRQGDDVVVTALRSYTLGDNVEELRFDWDGRGHAGTGNASGNVLSGSNGGDLLCGMAGQDRLWGHDGDDTLKGGAGRDYLRGDYGHDVYVYDALSETAGDRIELGNLDHIDLSAIDAKPRTAGDDAFTFRGLSAFSSNATGQVRVVPAQDYDASLRFNSSVVLISTDADPDPEGVIVVIGVTADKVIEDRFVL